MRAELRVTVLEVIGAGVAICTMMPVFSYSMPNKSVW